MHSLHINRFYSLFSSFLWYKSLALGVLMVVSVAGHGQIWRWAYPVENLQIADYAQDAEGNMAVFGEISSNSVRLGDTTVYSHDLANFQRGYFIAKLSVDGKVLWHDFLVWSGPNNTGIIHTNLGGVSMDHEGNVIICGPKPETITWSGGHSTNAFGLSSSFVMKYDSNGAVAWFKELNKNGELNFEIKGIRIDQSGNIFLGLLHNSNHVFEDDTLAGTFSITKLNPAGGYEWGRGFQPKSRSIFGYEPILVFEVTPSGNVYVLATLNEVDTLFVGNFAIPSSFSDPNKLPGFESYLTTLSTSGQALNAIRVLSDSQVTIYPQLQTYASATDINENFLLLIRPPRSYSIRVLGSSTPQPPQGYIDSYMVLSIDLNLNLNWTTSFYTGYYNASNLGKITMSSNNSGEVYVGVRPYFTFNMVNQIQAGHLSLSGTGDGVYLKLSPAGLPTTLSFEKTSFSKDITQGIVCTGGNVNNWFPGFSLGGISLPPFSTNNPGYLGQFVDTDLATPSFMMKAEGFVFQEDSIPCSEKKPLTGWPVEFTSTNGTTYSAFTDDSGKYQAFLPTGTYNFSVKTPPSRSYQALPGCNASLSGLNLLDGGNDTLIGRHGVIVLPCRHMEVKIGSTARRYCLPTTTRVTYCNKGILPIPQARVYVRMDSLMEVLSTSIPYTDSAGIMIFAVGNLAPDQCGEIVIVDKVMCGDINEIMGAPVCTEAWGYPANDCETPNPNWNGASIKTEALCLQGGIAVLRIVNTSNVPMTDSSEYRIFIDSQLVYVGPFLLGAFDTLAFQGPGLGQMLRIEADQPAFHPGPAYQTATVENCNGSITYKAPQALLLNYAQHDPYAQPDRAVECMQVTGSYDPNDKLASPKGVTAQGLIRKGQWIDYKIRFQNTGTDTAFTVRLIDTLDTRLEITSLEFGAASHPSTWSLINQDPPVFEAVFSNILLPDSNVNEPASHGFLNFLMKTHADLPEGAEIRNFADIYFDFNPPIRTNTVLHTISEFRPVPDTARLKPCTPQSIAYPLYSDTALCHDQLAAFFENVPSSAVVRFQVWENNAWGPYLDVAEMRGLNPATYAIRQSVFACEAPQTHTFTLTLYAVPAAPLLQMEDDILKVSSPVEGEISWFAADTLLPLSGRENAPLKAGTYKVRITSEQGCVSDFSEEVFFTPPPVKGFKLSGGPNPSLDTYVLSIQAESPATTRLFFCDLTGKVVSPTYSLTDTPEPQTLELPVKGLAEGVYFLRIDDGKNKVSVKVMVLK
jgi:uncharacterized repeat protein (TIGR01451 family)